MSSISTARNNDSRLWEEKLLIMKILTVSVYFYKCAEYMKNKTYSFLMLIRSCNCQQHFGYVKCHIVERKHNFRFIGNTFHVGLDCFKIAFSK